MDFTNITNLGDSYAAIGVVVVALLALLYLVHLVRTYVLRPLNRCRTRRREARERKRNPMLVAGVYDGTCPKCGAGKGGDARGECRRCSAKEPGPSLPLYDLHRDLLLCDCSACGAAFALLPLDRVPDVHTIATGRV